MFVLFCAALLGGLVTFAFSWHFGFVVALIATPFGGSIMAAAAATALAMRSAKPDLSHPEPDEMAARPRPFGDGLATRERQ
jgi:hypothetical protein